jgi:hypothetical protein
MRHTFLHSLLTFYIVSSTLGLLQQRYKGHHALPGRQLVRSFFASKMNTLKQSVTSMVAYSPKTNRMPASTLNSSARDRRFWIILIGQAGNPPFSSLYTRTGRQHLKTQGADLQAGPRCGYLEDRHAKRVRDDSVSKHQAPGSQMRNPGASESLEQQRA